MERSEPSLVPEWLRSTGGGTGAGSSSHHFASSQADGPVLALPKRNRSSKSIGNSDGPFLLERSSSSNSRRSSSSNGSTRNDKNSYSRSYSSFNRSQRDKDRERVNIADSWDLEYTVPLRSMTGKTEDTLRRSRSMISGRQSELPQRRVSTELRNGSHNNQDNVNGTSSVSSIVTGIQKMSLERDFPSLGSDERPKTPDIIRVSSPGLSMGTQSLSMGNSPLAGSEGWTSALAEVPTGAGSNSIGSSPAVQPPVAGSASGSNSTSGVGHSSSGLNMAEALVQAPTRSHNVSQPSSQMQRDELAIAQSKKLIPVTPSLPKTLVNSSDKLKPKTAVRSTDGLVAPKNGVHQLSQLHLGGQSIRGTSVRVDGPKSPSGKLLLLKAGRENGVSPGPKDIQVQTSNIGNRVANGHSTAASTVASVPLKSPNNPKVSSSERKTSGFGLTPGSVGEKNHQSRNDFFNLMRKKSMNGGSGTGNSGSSVSSGLVDKPDKERKEQSSAELTPVETGSEVKCNGETSTAAESFSQTTEDDSAALFTDEKELALLRQLGWDENAGGDDVAPLTDEEIDTFYQKYQKYLWRLSASSQLCRGPFRKILSHFELRAACSGVASTEPSASASQTEA